MLTRHQVWLQLAQPVSRSQNYEWHLRAIAELASLVEAIGATTAVELGSGEPPSATTGMLRGCGLTVTTVDYLAAADVRADMHDLPFDDDSFDLAVSRHSLEHCAAPVLALYEMRRIARVALVIVPEDCDKFLHWRGHFSVFSRRVWEHLFTLGGWHIRYFGEGNFAPDTQADPDIEWRYVLDRDESLRAYQPDGRYVGRYVDAYSKLAQAGWQ